MGLGDGETDLEFKEIAKLNSKMGAHECSLLFRWPHSRPQVRVLGRITGSRQRVASVDKDDGA